MTTVLEIEQAIERLPKQDFRILSSWMQEKIESDEDQVFEESVLAGKFDHLAEQALKEIAAGQTMPLDDLIRSHPRSAHPSGGAAHRPSRRAPAARLLRHG